MTSTRARPVVAGILVAVLLAACSSAGGQAPRVEASPSAPAVGATPPVVSPPTPVPVPSAPGGSVDEPGSGGGSAPNPGGGVAVPAPAGPGGDAGGAGPQPTLVAPVAGLSGVHPVGAASLETALSGRDLKVKVTWWSGIAPCSVLAGVDVARDGNTITLTVREGSGAAPDTACIDIAQLKGTVVDIGELEPGTYTVAAFGAAAPVTVTIDG
jgi:hypothetical protein